jgi:hypothetical protein
MVYNQGQVASRASLPTILPVLTARFSDRLTGCSLCGRPTFGWRHLNRLHPA